MLFPKKIYLLSLSFSLLAIYGVGLLPSLSQDNDIDTRIEKQTRRINRAVKEGTLQPKQAAELQKNLKSISQEVETSKGQSKGGLTTSQMTKLNNELNQNASNIKTQIGSGIKAQETAQTIGPKWSESSDGAQDPKKLRTQMKIQEKRQVKQYEQAMQQVQEQQQQQYEKEMLDKLGQQRPAILKNTQDIEEIRQKTGAN